MTARKTTIIHIGIWQNFSKNEQSELILQYKQMALFVVNNQIHYFK
jgi:hypothetical protein